MSTSESANLPLWVQDRETVIANDEGVNWREKKRPDYSETNKSLRQGSKYSHLEGSLEGIVQNLVRTFEMEATYKTDPKQWLAIVNDKFRMITNGGPAYTADDVAAVGTYNLFLEKTEHYDPKAETFESSVEVFHNAFPDGFLWELVEVFSGPPTVTFQWRHWGSFTGPFKDHAPTGEKVEITGVTVARVTDDLKILSLEHFFDTGSFIGKLATGCPFHSQKS